MNKTVLVVVGLVLIILGGIYFFNQGQSTDTAGSYDSGPTATPGDLVEGSRYIAYSQASYDDNADKKRVLYFYAVWCPTCKIANEEFNNNLDKIPEDVILLKTDYDSETALKKKYNITYQHTFVLVDEAGNEITKWNGGGIDELVDNAR